tara:strand:+ start:207 stop:878 length:672 start_codon:yes stop_codon:yes gene_type:complete
LLKTAPINQAALLKINKNIQKYSPYPEKVKLIAVTKNLKFSSIKSSYENQIFNIGESRLQETQQKIKNKQNIKELNWHFIGPLQTNKIKKIVKIYNIIQTVDTEKKAEKINKEAKKINKKQSIMIQVNISKAQQQQGVFLDHLEEFYLKINKLTNIKVLGFMAIGPNTENKKEIKEKFRELKQFTQKKYKNKSLELSLGMSDDYTIALQEGSTYIRIGTKLFT